MREIREFHGREVESAYADWTRMVRSACRMLVLQPELAESISVSAVFANDELEEAARVACRLATEYGIETEITLGAFVSVRLSRSRGSRLAGEE